MSYTQDPCRNEVQMLTWVATQSVGGSERTSTVVSRPHLKSVKVVYNCHSDGGWLQDLLPNCLRPISRHLDHETLAYFPLTFGCSFPSSSTWQPWFYTPTAEPYQICMHPMKSKVCLILIKFEYFFTCRYASTDTTLKVFIFTMGFNHLFDKKHI